MWLHTDLFLISVESKWSKPNFCWEVSAIPTNMNTCRYEASLITHSSGLMPSDVCVRFFSNPVHLGGGEWRGGCHGDLRKKTVRVGRGGGWASLLPSCSWLHCAAAVSAGMAPLTICSLIANIRVHFLRHWSGTERWRAELWAFLSLPLCLSRSCSTLPGDGGRTHKHTHSHTRTWQAAADSSGLSILSCCVQQSIHLQTHKFNNEWMHFY